MKLLQELIKIPSISGNEKNIQGFIFKYLKSLGLTPKFIGANVVVHISGENKTNALMFNAHVDTVAVGDKSQWKHDPFEGKIIGDKIYGLGASDEKAAVATLLLLAEKFSKEKPAVDVWLTFVVKEEVDGSGSKEVLSWFAKNYQKKYQEVFGILGEPTGLTHFEIAHKGNAFVHIKTRGDSGHASDPGKIKTHAVFQMYQVIKKLKKLQRVWKKEYADKILNYPTIGIATSICGGDKNSPNKFADSCTITCDIRTTPQLHTVLLAQLRKELSEAEVEYLYPPVGYGYTSLDDPFVGLVKKITKAKMYVPTWSNDLCFFTAHKIPAIVYGPGEREVIHTPNEFCYLSKVVGCMSIYSQIISSNLITS